MVNSSAYGFQRQISSVQHAVMILGFGAVRGIVLSAGIFKLFEGNHRQSLDPLAFWRHAIATALGSRVIAKTYQVPYAEDAFSAGILHDIGKMILDCYFTDRYAPVLAANEKLPPHGERFKALEQTMLDLDHTLLGHRLALRWKLPATMIDVIAYHHTPQEAQSAPGLVYTVALANVFSVLAEYNYGVLDMQQIPEDVCQYFGWQMHDAPETHAAVERLFKTVLSALEEVDMLLDMLQG
jgi:putative nucleotidyltransferase with HDIG domain